MRKTKILSLMMMVCMLLSTSVFAATKSGGVSGDSALIGMPEYGWTTFTINAKMYEDYTTTSDKVTYNRHYTHVTVEASRDDSGIQLSIVPVPRHYDSSNNTVKKLTMTSYSTILPGGLYGWYCKESKEKVTYVRSNSYKSGFGMSLFATGCLNPYGKTIAVNLKV